MCEDVARTVHVARQLGEPLPRERSYRRRRVPDDGRLETRLNNIDDQSPSYTTLRDLTTRSSTIAMVAAHTEGLRVLQIDGELEVMRILTDRREILTRRRVSTVNRLQAMLTELLPGQTKADIRPGQGDAGQRPPV